MPQRIGISFSDWPSADRVAWQAALVAGNLFDGDGIAANWRAQTRAGAIAGYGLWLAFLRDQDPALLDLEAGARATSVQLRAYADHRLSRVRRISVAADLNHLVLALRAIVPDHDNSALRALQYATQRNASTLDKRRKMVTADRLVDLGIELMTRADDAGVVEDVRAYRDGLLIALLATRPLRRSNLAALRLDCHVEEHGDAIALLIPAELTKNHRFIECWVPDHLAPYFRRFLREIRPLFYGVVRHNGLWPSSKGRPLTSAGIYQVVIRRTASAFGHPINPHLFRDIAATTLALSNPEHALLARDLLHHSSFSTTERHYLHAQTVDAGRAYGTRIRELRRRTSALSGQRVATDNNAK